jgi:hypothetical protein
MPTRILLVLSLFSLTARAAPPVDAAALAAADAADLRLRTEGTCRPADLDLVRAGIAALAVDAKPSRIKGDPWHYPIAGHTAARSLGGEHGSGYVVAGRDRCYAHAAVGHPAHDLFVDDPDQDSLDAKGLPYNAVAVEEGLVLLARGGWAPGNPLKGGNYVVLYLPARGQLVYYAHLATLRVTPGERVQAGDVLGTLGRTGRNAFPKRSPTHLHFALWDASTLTPVNPWPLLAAAR